MCIFSSFYPDLTSSQLSVSVLSFQVDPGGNILASAVVVSRFAVSAHGQAPLPPL